MNVLIVDMTHGGVSIASEFAKINNCNVFAMDIYNTLDSNKKDWLAKKGIIFVQKEFLDNDSNDVVVIAPVHSPIESNMTHHDAVKQLLKNKIKVPVIEVTGVKGKTSVVWMLKKIFKTKNPLILSSLGIEVIQDNESIILKKDISITPASILEALNLANNYNIGICIFETSLGGTGLADIGVLTNIAENYPIASGSKTASQAKKQIFKNKMNVCYLEAYNKYYSKYKNTNTFSIKGEANVTASNIHYNLHKTIFNVDVNDLITYKGHILNDSFTIETFAPAEHHVLNVLCAICASLTIDIPSNQIIHGLEGFKGLNGRTSIKRYGNIDVIQEINPGINVSAIKKSVQMIYGNEGATLIFGGKYGITCEEIDEEDTARYLNTLDEKINLILVDELGENIKNRIKRKYKYTCYDNAIKDAREINSKMILLIYRSNFSDISKR